MTSTNVSKSPLPGFPVTLADSIRALTRTRGMSAGIDAMADRGSEFPSQTAMILAGLAVFPDSRQALETVLDDHWAGSQFRFLYGEAGGGPIPEVIIGGGVHAAIYAATRVATGKPAPLVIERGRPGGAFAVSGAQPSFYLNSENRSGALGYPRDGDALNYLPNATIQVSDFTRAEFPTNADVALAVRLALAQYATVVTGRTVTRIDAPDFGAGASITLDDGSEYRAGRVIDVRGLGDPSDTNIADGELILTFPQFMARFAGPFPTRGFGRVAVIGSGDSARVTIEALTGIGPGAMMAAMSLDSVPRVDWYGRGLPRTREDYRDSFSGQRGRYLRLASYLPTSRDSRSYHDVTVLDDSGLPARTGNGVLVNGRNYDHAILATGNELDSLGLPPFRFDAYTLGRTAIAQKYDDLPVYRAGPAADIPFSSSEEDAGIADVSANRVSIFRYAARTAALAAGL